MVSRATNVPAAGWYRMPGDPAWAEPGPKVNVAVPPTGMLEALAMAGHPGNGAVVVVSGVVVGGFVVGEVVESGVVVVVEVDVEVVGVR